MLFFNEGTVTSKHSKYGDISRIPNIKTSGHENKRSPTLAHMSTRVKRNSGTFTVRRNSAHSPVCLNSTNLPDSKPITSNSRSPCIAKITSAEKKLPRSLRQLGILSPGDDKSKSTKKIKPRRPLDIITRPTSENKYKSIVNSSAANPMGRPQCESTLRISTEKECTETTQALREKTEPADRPSEHKAGPEILRVRRTSSKTDYAKYLSPTHKKQLCADNKTLFSFSAKHRNARINLMRKFLDTKVKIDSLLCELGQYE